MAVRTVRLDPEAESALSEIRDATGLPISEALKRGLHALRDQVRQGTEHRPYDVYAELDLGPGGYASGPARDAKQSVRERLKKKVGR
jgi:hypothetical protein